MLVDTHCHLNFKSFEGRVEQVVKEARKARVNNIIVPGTDLPNSIKAIEIAEDNKGVYAAVGIHPHHVFEIYSNTSESFFSTATPRLSGPLAIVSKKISSFLDLLKNPNVVAIGEVGIDRHYYQKTKHKDYKVEEEFVDLQKEFFIEQIKLAGKYNKALIIHNREAKKDVLKILTDYGLLITDYRSVFHCCEPDDDLLNFAIDKKMYIGVDGDIVYWKEKQEFIKRVPLKMLVLETDSPFLSPYKKFPNEPKNIVYIAETIAKLKKVSIDEVEKTTTENTKILFKNI